MCGISAVISATGNERGPAATLQRMHALLAHRGPDAEGFVWVDPQMRAGSVRGERVGPEFRIPEEANAAAAFRWLRIQDLDPASNQPMASADGSLWLLFNGEIYNHAELRRELSRHGFEFHGKSDTEVILAAYRHWGTACFARLAGMWAILIFDLARRRAIVSRDRLGIKPLFYARQAGRLLLASEAKALALSGSEGPAAEPFRMHEFLRGLPPQSADLSYFRGVRPVPAGTWAEVALDSSDIAEPSFQRFWDLADYRVEDLPESEFERARDQFESLLIGVVREHAKAAVDVGALLSGGLDTSLLARLLAANADGPLPKAFSIIFEDPQMSEWPYIQLVLARGGLQGANLVLKPEDAWAATEAVVRAQGRPLLGQDAIAQFCAYRLARQHGTTVVLDGQGADELLAGLPLYDAQIFPDLLRRGHWVRLASELAARMRRYDLSWRRAWKLYVRTPIIRQRMEDRGLPKYDWLEHDRFDSSQFGPGRTDDWGPERSRLSRYLYRHVRHTNLPAVLIAQDHSSMSHAIESRVPFLDHRLVEFVFRLPERFKARRGVRKRILLETARKHLPEAVVERRDKRMFISKPAWMNLRQSHAAELRAMAASTEVRDFGLLRRPKVQAFVEDYIAGKHTDEMAVWRLYTLWHWLRAFRATA